MNYYNSHSKCRYCRAKVDWSNDYRFSPPRAVPFDAGTANRHQCVVDPKKKKLIDLKQTEKRIAKGMEDDFRERQFRD